MSSHSLLGGLFVRLVNPKHLYQIIVRQRHRKSIQRVYDDAQLKLYNRLLPGDHLHYGYFDNPDIDPLDMSLSMVYEAQNRYARLLADLVHRTDLPILDVGCGMGGLLGELNKRGLTAKGLTPDKNQASHIRRTYPNELFECKFEDFKQLEHSPLYGTVITSESLQYLDLKRALPLMNSIMEEGGRWITCDYFRQGAAVEKSGHYWEFFVRQLDEHGFKIVEHRDITPNILPTIAFAHHWGAKVLLPLVEFAEEKLEVKAPGWHYAFQTVITGMYLKIGKNLATIDPQQFAASKKYILMVIERK